MFEYVGSLCGGFNDLQNLIVASFPLLNFLRMTGCQKITIVKVYMINSLGSFEFLIHSLPC